MTAATQIVSTILGEAIDNDAILRDIDAILKEEETEKALIAHDDIEISFGFYVGSGDSRMIEDNLREDGIDPKSLDWNRLSLSFANIERNMLRILGQNGLSVRGEGHSDNGDVVGTAWLHTKPSRYDDTLNKVGMELLKNMVDSGESLDTGSGSIHTLKGAETLFKDVDPIIERACEVQFGIFDTDKLKAFFKGLDNGVPLAELVQSLEAIGESFLAPPAPPGIFRKVIDGVEIYSARCPGCKRIHGNFRTYDQAAGNRQCKFCTRDFVDKMTKVTTTGNFKHILKKPHEVKASGRPVVKTP